MRKINFIIINIFITFFVSSLETFIYWENEKILQKGDISKFDVASYESITAILFTDSNNRKISFIYSTDQGNNWSNPLLITNTYFTRTDTGNDFSLKFDRNKNLYIAYRIKEKKIIIERLKPPYTSKENFIEIESDNIIYLPQLFIDSNNNINLFVSTNIDNEIRLEHIRITNEKEIKRKLITDNLRSIMNPVIREIGSNYYILFQAKDTEKLPSLINYWTFNSDVIKKIENEDEKKFIQNIYLLDPKSNIYKLKNITEKEKDNLFKIFEKIKFIEPFNTFYSIFLASSNDKGENWSIKKIIPTSGEHNQRPEFIFYKNDLIIAWERNDQNFTSHIYYTIFDITTLKEKIPVTLISDPISEAHSPYLIVDKGIVYLFWYDNKSDSFQNYYTSIDYPNIKILKPKTGRTILNSVIYQNNNIMLFWLHNNLNENTLYFIKKDDFVEKPSIFVRNIGKERITNSNNITIEWSIPKDTSGILGYRMLLTQDINEPIPEKYDFFIDPTITLTNYKNLSDGKYFFKIVAFDNAGNRSEESIYSFEIDTTPPEPPKFVDIELDENMALLSNSPVIKWASSSDGVKDRYRYYYKFITDINEYENIIKKVKDSDFIPTNTNYIEFKDLDNGYLIVGVKGYDIAGTISDTNWNVFKLDKYVVKTFITEIVTKKINDLVAFNIFGRGFNIDGDISKIIIDSDRIEPYDYVMDSKYFNVINDRAIIQIKGIEIKEGSYYIGVEHPIRGTHFYSARYKYEEKWGFIFKETKPFSFETIRLWTKGLNLTTVIIISLISIWVLLVSFILLSIIQVGNERIYINNLIRKYEIFKEDFKNLKIKPVREALMKKGIGFTVKYTLLILFLVILIVTSTSVTLSFITLKNQRANLGKMMKDKAEIVMKNYQASIQYVYNFTKRDYEAYDAMDTFLTLKDVGFVIFRKKNEAPVIKIGNNESLSAFTGTKDLETFEEKEKIKLIEDYLFTKDNEKLIQQIEKEENSLLIIPEFKANDLHMSYVFIKPIVTFNKEFIGEIYIGFSFVSIINTIREETINLIKITIYVTLIAIIISVIGAIFLATTTIRPIKTISEHVNNLSELDDYEKLVGTPNEKILIKTKDEIGILGAAINEMTHKLIEKSKADKQMLLGKEIQKKFIPLEPFESDTLEIYGYYEGAKGVSGDYFDYKKLDDDHYAFIICDVSGKAVPAALIMVQISTIFHSYFANFNITKNKLDTVEIVTRINDTVEERGFQGRFAAILVVILEISTGKVMLTNAGYTQLLVFRNKKNETEWIQLNEAGAAGVFPSYMLPQPFKQEYLHLDHGDIIFLFTDGFEESRNGKEIIDEKGEKKFEEFGTERIKQVLDKSKGKKAKDIIAMLVEAEKNFRGDLEQYDDLTILAIKRK
ncbi:MAG TPA: SpoIIE family protein phosphatase [Spirochaetota bacterium]|nr:SpoIIE family protein phosphatase [Spirochaetota bacterium]